MIAALFLIFFSFVAIGVPIAFSMGLAALLVTLWEPFTSAVIFQRMVSGVDSFPLLALPLFVLAGTIMHHGKVSEKMLAIINSLMGHVTGGLAMVTAFSSCLFGFITGSTVADVAAIGSIMMPEMVKRGYSKGFTASLQACAGVLGGLIPPSIVLVVIGVVGGMSIGNLLLGAIIPGWLCGFALMITAYFISRKRKYQGGGKRENWREIVVAARKSFLPLMTPVIVLGGMYTGIFTPTEAAAVAVDYGLFLGLIVYKTIKLKDLYKIFQEAIIISVSILIIIAFGSTFCWLLATYRGPEVIRDLFLSLTHSYIIMTMLIVILILILGMIMEGTAIIIIFIPVLLPLAVNVGWDPVHFGVVFALSIIIGNVTPPVGVGLMTACRVLGIPYPPAFRDYIPFVLTMIIVLILSIAFPSLTLWLGRG